MTVFWPRLYEEKAFKSAPALWELADAHVPLADVQVAQPPEPMVLSGLREQDGLVLLVGPSGSGKSSVLAHAAECLGNEAAEDGRRYLPLFVPVAPRAADARSVEGFGRVVMFELLTALRDSLPPVTRHKVERALSQHVTVEKTPTRFNAKLTGKVFGVGGEAGVAFAEEVVSVSGNTELDNRGGVKTLGDIARSRGFEIVVLVEDTDAWANMPGGDSQAAAFIAVLQTLSRDTDLAMGIAIQNRWATGSRFDELAQRAVTVARMPEISALAPAKRLITAIIDRRANRVIDPEELPNPSDSLFTDHALGSLAQDLLTAGSVRSPLAWLRDALDHFSDSLPERIERDHLVEALAHRIPPA